MKRFNQLSGKEQIEWSNFWYDYANIQTERRILFVGGSASRQIRRTLSEVLKCPVDLFGTSAALRDQLFWDQWECFFKNNLYKYDAIFVWVGNHSRISEDGKTLFTNSDYQHFQEDFTYLIEQCQHHSPKLIILTVLNLFKCRKYNKYIERIRRRFKIKPKEKYLENGENVVIEEKNRIIKKVAEEKRLPFCDINAILINSDYWHTDSIHYIRESNIFVCNTLKRFL